MFCPRLEHFTRLNQDGTVGKCGHMINGRGFDSFNDLENSEWLKTIKDTMQEDQWPKECQRCQQSEKAKGESVRTNSIKRHKILSPMRKDYLIVGGVLDNVCNSACQSCNPYLSTKIGSLESTDYPRIDNYVRFWELPLHRVLELDVNGGEPTASRNYKRVLSNLPENIRIVRMNTNGSRTIEEIEHILEKGIMVIVTMSLDGIDKVHDYVRWPIKWDNYQKTVDSYKRLQEKHKLLHLDFWTTVSSLNVATLPQIQKFALDHETPHDWAFLDNPRALNVRYKNAFTERAKNLYPDQIAVDSDNQKDFDQFVQRQDRLRGINIKDYLEITT